MKTKVIAKGMAGYELDVNPSEVYNHPEVKNNNNTKGVNT